MPQSRHQRKKIKKKNSYRLRNWSEYNAALKKRASLTIWLSDEALANWRHQGPPQRGAQYRYSELAIQTALTVKTIYHLGLRQTEGFLQSLAKLFGVEIDVPDYSTLSRRQKTLTVPLAASSPRGPVYVVVDSTGVKVFGEGEWKVRQHGISKRRTWRKLHVAVNEATGEALAVELTTNSVDDAAEVKPLLAQIATPIKAFGGDGGYDKKKVYSTLDERGRQQRTSIQINIPPRKDAKIIQHGNSAHAPLARDENLRAIREHGRQRWKEQCGYHRRSLAETFMFRYKTIIGPQLKARVFAAQQIEIRIGCIILNRMTALGMPDSYKQV
jgi:hypothetical protein